MCTVPQIGGRGRPLRQPAWSCEFLVRSRLVRRGRIVLALFFLLQGPGLLSRASDATPSPVLIGILSTGHTDPALSDSLDKTLRAELPDLASRLRLISREARFVQTDVMRELAELISLRPNVLLCLDLFCANVAKSRRPGGSPPMVFLAHADPLANGLIQSYARPGNNLTGVTTYRCVDSKMLEILVDSFPTRKRVGYLTDASDLLADDNACLNQAQHNAVRMQISLIRIDVSSKDFLASLDERLKSLRLDAVLAPASAPVWQNRQAVVKALSDAQLPAIYENGIFLAEGGLMSYGPVRTNVIPQLAKFVAKILRGEPAGDIPVEQPTLFEFAINLRAPHFSEFGIKAATLRHADRIQE
jgi:putative tryptophan/tyrosine transport system substrate-binding protein